MESLEKNVSFILVYDPKKTKSTEKPHVTTATPDLTAYRSYTLLVLDYFGIYVPQVWLERFHYLKTMLHDEQKGWSASHSVVQRDNLKVVDMTQDLHQCLYKTDDMVDFSLFPDVLFCVFQGHSSSFMTTRQRRVIRFLMPFIEFLAPCTVEVEYWRKKSQSYFLLSDMDV